MPTSPMPDLTRRESQIMEILYRRRRASVEEMRAELPDAPGPSSVRKLLDIMIDRRLLEREYDGPRFVYFPRRDRNSEPVGIKQIIRRSSTTRRGRRWRRCSTFGDSLSDAEYQRLPRCSSADARKRSMSTLLQNPAWAALVALLVKATALVCVAATAQLLLRRRGSAATRHGVWALTVAGLLLLPPLALTGPQWPVQIGLPANSRPWHRRSPRHRLPRLRVPRHRRAATSPRRQRWRRRRAPRPIGRRRSAGPPSRSPSTPRASCSSPSGSLRITWPRGACCDI